MSTSSIPLKIKNTNGDLQEFIPSEEAYLSHMVGEALAEVSAGDVGAISLTGDVNIGSFVDNFYNQPTGTHPVSNITSTTTTTTLKQVSGPADESGTDFSRPVGYYESGPNPGFYEMVESDLDNLTSRAMSNLFTLHGKGTYYLASTPSQLPTTYHSDYEIAIENAFSNTNNDGAVTNYHLWRRVAQAGTINPEVVRPVTTVYDGSSLDGFKEMTDAQIKYTLGQRAKSLMATAGAIGSYQLRSSAQGQPTLPGTWSGVGTAQNTIHVLEETNYTFS